MKIARILYPVRVLGPGARIGIWTAGCIRKCNECTNPELQAAENFRDLDLKEVFSFLDKLFEEHDVDGITISGGEPFMQTGELKRLVEYLLTKTEDILIYTGYDLETLKKRKHQKEETDFCLEKAAVIIDGRYDSNKNFSHPLRGSENQRIFYRDEETRKKYEKYIDDKRGKNEVQNFQISDGIVSVGIHGKDFVNQFRIG